MRNHIGPIVTKIKLNKMKVVDALIFDVSIRAN